MKCRTCSEVLELYGTTESVAPWLCECFKPSSPGEKCQAFVQLNIQGCTCRVRKSKYSRNSVIWCKCE